MGKFVGFSIIIRFLLVLGDSGFWWLFYGIIAYHGKDKSNVET
jgi:hypothetical protein